MSVPSTLKCSSDNKPTSVRTRFPTPRTESFQHLVSEESPHVLGEHGRIEARLHKVHVHRTRAYRRFVVQFLSGRLSRCVPRTSETEKPRLQQSFGRDEIARPMLEYILSKSSDMRERRLSATYLINLRGWSGGTRSSRLTKTSMVVWGLQRSLMGRSPGQVGYQRHCIPPIRRTGPHASFFSSLLVKTLNRYPRYSFS